jgi:hypothetical protein
MASGDVVFEYATMGVNGVTSDFSINDVVQTATFNGSSEGATPSDLVTSPFTLSYKFGSSHVVTDIPFDSTKQYKLTITEV